MYENEPTGADGDRTTARIDETSEESFFEVPRLGHDIRFVFAAVGGGAVRIGREVARHHLKYVETVAINCDLRVQDLEEYDRRVYLGSDWRASVDAGGSPHQGSEIARAAAPALERLFEGSTFVTILASLGGGAGTGALPHVLDAAARSARVLSVFVVKPFKCEGDRRAVADRALARLHFVNSFVEKQERGAGKLQVLDNEAMRAKGRTTAFRDINAHWGRVVAAHIDRAFIAPSEAVLDDFRMAYTPSVDVPLLTPRSEPTRPTPVGPVELPPLGPTAAWEATERPETELTFEIGGAPPGPDLA